MEISPLRGPARVLLFTLLLGCSAQTSSQASMITLQNPTATFSQGGFSPAQTIDGNLAANNGWAIFPNVTAQTIVWETAADQGSGNDLITFDLIQNQGLSHTLLRFRLSYTTDDRTLFADGLATGGDVTANWNIIDLSSFSATGGTTLAELADFSILAGGPNPAISTYMVSFQTMATGITGFRLEALEDPSSTAGPGRQANQNFVLTEMQIDVTPGTSQVPEPASATLAILGVFGFGMRALRRRTVRR